MKRIKRIGALSLGCTLAMIYLVIGLISAIVILSISNSSTEVSEGLDPIITTLGYWIVLVFPIFYAMGGFIIGVLIAFLYNVIAMKTGGVKLDIA